MISVLLVDDHPSVRRALRRLLERSGDVQVVAEAADGAQALGELQAVDPDVILLDIQMPRMDGFALLDTLKTKTKHPKVIVLTMFSLSDTKQNALAAGAHAFVPKQKAYERLLPTIRQVAATA